MANKQIKDFDLKESIDGEEDLLIQDSDGVTKRIKTSSVPSIDCLRGKSFICLYISSILIFSTY